MHCSSSQLADVMPKCDLLSCILFTCFMTLLTATNVGQCAAGNDHESALNDSESNESESNECTPSGESAHFDAVKVTSQYCILCRYASLASLATQRAQTLFERIVRLCSYQNAGLLYLVISCLLA